MRKIHIDYLKNLVAGIALGGTSLVSPERFLEIDPPTDRFQELIPFCIVKYLPVSPVPNKRKVIRLSDRISGSDRYIRKLKQHFKMEYRYTLNFWLGEPELDVISAPGKTGSEPLIQPGDIGVIDQTLLYLATHQRILGDQKNTIEIYPGRCAIVSDPAGELGLYKIYAEIVFSDGLHEIEENLSLTNAQTEAIEPVEVQTI
ncbi:MAG: hypothetical protein HS129_15065 [Leptospiraceae bacterium]|nr:hypothetical protein [Leptospiraceae bacterium]